MRTSGRVPCYLPSTMRIRRVCLCRVCSSHTLRPRRLPLGRRGPRRRSRLAHSWRTRWKSKKARLPARHAVMTFNHSLWFPQDRQTVEVPQAERRPGVQRWWISAGVSAPPAHPHPAPVSARPSGYFPLMPLAIGTVVPSSHHTTQVRHLYEVDGDCARGAPKGRSPLPPPGSPTTLGAASTPRARGLGKTTRSAIDLFLGVHSCNPPSVPPRLALLHSTSTI